MKRMLRRVTLAAGIVLAVLAVLVLGAPRLIRTEAVTARIEREVARATGADVTLGGAHVRWRGRWGLTLTGGSISGTGAALAAATGSPNDLEYYECEIGELDVGVSLLPLLRRRLEVATVTVSGPGLTVRWDRGEAVAKGYRIRLTDLDLGLESRPSGSRPGVADPGGRIPEDLSFAFTAGADTLFLQEVPYTEFAGEGGFAARKLEVDALSARRSTGLVTGDLTIDFGAPPRKHLVFAAEVRAVPAAALLDPFIPEVAARLDGELDGDLEGECDLGDGDSVARTLVVKGRLTGGPGALHAADWLEGASPYLGARQDLKDIAFRDLDHMFAYAGGRYHFGETALTGGDTEWAGSGWLEPGGNIDMRVGVRLPAGFTPDLGNFSFLAAGLRDSEGRINLPLKLTGPAARPDVGVDFARLRRK